MLDYVAYSSWFVAAFCSSCAECDGDIKPDDTICSDGAGGFLCEACGAEEGYHCDC
jgi:hypothetical protein